MWLVLGLGNPGSEYRGTRHNVGFAVVECLAARHGIDLSKQRHLSLYGRGKIGREDVLLAKPQTFMNLSGEAARPLLGFHGIGLPHLIVIHDDADFAAGTVKVKQGGGAGGHNGISSIIEHTGSGEFARIRIGVGRPDTGGRDMARHVLSRPSPQEAALFREAELRAADAVEAILARGLSMAMNEINRTSPV